jgi:hypothetical protein
VNTSKLRPSDVVDAVNCLVRDHEFSFKLRDDGALMGVSTRTAEVWEAGEFEAESTTRAAFDTLQGVLDGDVVCGSPPVPAHGAWGSEPCDVVRDVFGTVIEVGMWITYPSRCGSDMHMETARVEGVAGERLGLTSGQTLGHIGLLVVKSSGRKTRICRVDNVVVAPSGWSPT